MTARAELLEALHHADPDVRRRAARALDHVPLDEQTVAALIALVRREQIPAVRSAAVHVLACARDAKRKRVQQLTTSLAS